MASPVTCRTCRLPSPAEPPRASLRPCRHLVKYVAKAEQAALARRKLEPTAPSDPKRRASPKRYGLCPSRPPRLNLMGWRPEPLKALVSVPTG